MSSGKKVIFNFSPKDGAGIYPHVVNHQKNIFYKKIVNNYFPKSSGLLQKTIFSLMCELFFSLHKL